MVSSIERVNYWNIGWTLAYTVVVLLVCVSNILTTVAFTMNVLRRRSYYQVLNLSVADAAVGAIVMPLYIHIQSITRSTTDSVKYVLYFADPFFGLASFLILVMISCERLHAVARPFKHRSLQKRYYVICVAFPWLIAAAIAAADGWPTVAWLPFPLHLPVISLGLAVICCSYMAIWMKKTIHYDSDDRHSSRLRLKHRQLAKTLFITTVASLLTWLPVYVYITYHFACGQCPHASHHIAFALKLLQFTNSFINGVIYSLRMPEFRGAIRQVFHRELTRTIRTLSGTSRNKSGLTTVI